MSIQELLGEVLKCQKLVSDSQQLLFNLNQAATKEQEKIDHAEEASEAIVDLTREEEDLLAETAIGNNVDAAQLDLVERQMVEAAENYGDIQTVAARAEKAKAGLLRKIKAAELALARAKDAHRESFVEYVTTMAEKEGVEYKQLAARLMKKSERIIAIGRILEKQPCNTGLSPIYSGHNERFLIPGFDLNSCRGGVHGDIWRLMIMEPEVILDQVAAIKSEIKALGVEIPT